MAKGKLASIYNNARKKDEDSEEQKPSVGMLRAAYEEAKNSTTSNRSTMDWRSKEDEERAAYEEALRRMRAGDLVYGDKATEWEPTPQTAIDLGVQRSQKVQGGVINAPVAQKTPNNQYAMTQQKTALSRERARLDDLWRDIDVSDTRAQDDWMKRSNAVNDALRRLESEMKAADNRAAIGQFEKVRGNADFEEYAQKGAAVETAKPQNFWTFSPLKAALSPAEEGYNKVKTVKQPEADTFSDRAMGVMDNLFNYGQSYGENPLAYMTQDETDVYNYLLAKDRENGTKESDAYIETLYPMLNERKATANVEGAQKWAAESAGNAALGSVASVLRSPANFGGYLDAAAQKAMGNGIDISRVPAVYTRMNNAVRGTVGGEISDALVDKTGSRFLGNAGEFLYQIGLSMADSLVNTAITGGNAVASSALMGGSAASSAMIDAKERGGNDAQALTVGALAGIAEALFEKVSIENFISEATAGTKGAWLLNILRQMGVEASEEGATEIANIISDVVVMGDLSQYRDMTASEIALQVAQAALGGAISGAGMGGFAQIGNYATRKANERAAAALASKPAAGADPVREAAMQAAIAQEEQQTEQPAQKTQEAPVEASEQNVDEEPAELAKPVTAVKQTRRDRAVNTETGEAIEVDGIDSVDDGVVYVRSGDDVIPAADVDFSDSNTAALYRAAGSFDTATAQRFVQEYDGSDVRQYAQAFSSVYNDGKAGIDYNTTLLQRASAAYLTESQRITAHAGGQKAASLPNVPKKFTPGLVRAYNKASLTAEGRENTKKFRRQLQALDVIGKKYNREILLVSSLKGMNIGGVTITGNVNGAYDPTTKRIYIAADAQDGAFAYVAMHELVHSIKDSDSKAYDRLRDVVFEALEASGEDVDALIDYQINSVYKGKIDRDGAIEEVISNTAPTVLMDEQFVRDLYANDRTLFDKIREFFEELKQVFAELTQSGSWAQDTVLDEESVAKIAEVFDKVAMETADLSQEGVVTNADGEAVAYSDGNGGLRFSEKTYREGGRDMLTSYLDKQVKSGEMSRADADDIVSHTDQVYEIMKKVGKGFYNYSNWAEAEVALDDNGDPVFSVVKANGDYAMNLDFSLVCKKRRTLDAVFNEMISRGIIDNFDLAQTEIVQINDIIRDYGFETACALCFVDAKRFRQAKVADDFVNMYNSAVRSMATGKQLIDSFNFGGDSTVRRTAHGIDKLPNDQLDFTKIDKTLAGGKKGTVAYKIAEHLKNHPEDRKLVARGDFMSSRGFDTIKKKNPAVLKLYNSKKGSGGPKAAFGDVQYLSDIIRDGKFKPEAAYAVGGVRVQSFSDYVPRLVFDYVQMIGDLAAKLLPAHSYTKEELFVKQYGLTGMKINMSLIPAVVDGAPAGLDADGNYAWAKESFDYDTAVEIQSDPAYGRNCGTICVGVSDEHIRKLMADPNIRMVIPYHKSGLNPLVAQMNKIGKFGDYTNPQNTRYANGKKLSAADHSKEPNFNQRLHELGADGDPRAVVEEYVRWCEDNNYLPKFDKFAYVRENGKPVVGADGRKVVDPNYYKLIEDFTVYDGDGNYVPQGAVRAVYPDDGAAFGSMTDLIKRGLEEDQALEDMRSEKVGDIVDEIQKTLKPKKGLKLSVRDQFSADYDQWAKNGRDDNAIIEVGTTPDVLQELGARKKKTVMQGASIKHAMNGHPEMTDPLMKQVPDALENPVIVLKSRVAPNTKNPGDRPQTVVVYGDLTDSEGNPILMAVNMKFSTPGRPAEVEDVQLIKNAYAKNRGLAGQVENSDVLYVSEDKKRTNQWLVDRRLQLPLISAHYGSIGSITETDDGVKIEGVPYNEWVSGNIETSRKDTNQRIADIRFSIKDPVERQGSLVAVHELSGENLMRSLRAGGFPMPSIAVTKVENATSGFGDVTVVFGSETIDPQAHPDNEVFSGDAFTPMYPYVAVDALITTFIRGDNDSKLLRATNENVVKVMKGTRATARHASSTKGNTGLHVDLMRKFSSVEDIHRYEQLLQADAIPVSKTYGNHPAYVAVFGKVNDIRNRLSALISHKHQNSKFPQAASDREAQMALSSLAEVQADNVSDVVQKLNSMNIPADKSIARDIVDVFDEIRNLPTSYFEAKPGRVVGNDEVKLVVVPDGKYRALKQMLKRKGIDFATYDGTAEDRVNVLNNRARALAFSQKDPAQRERDARTAERIAEGRKQSAAQQKLEGKHDAEIAKLKERIAELEQQAKDERAAGQINTAIERKAGRQAVEDARTAERMAEGRIRSEERQKAADALAEQKQKAAEREAALRQRKDDRIATLEGRIVADQVNRKVRTETQKYTERIMANAKTLTAWLIRPTDDNHVPEAMRNRIAKFIETIDFSDGSKFTNKSKDWKLRLYQLRDTMQSVDASSDAGLFLDIDPDLTEFMTQFLDQMPENVQHVGQMDVKQLKDLDRIMQTIKRTVVYANKNRANARYAQVSALGVDSIDQMNFAKGKSKFWQIFSGADKFFNVQQLDSFSFFEGLGDAAESVLEALRTGFDTKVKHVQQAVEYVKPFVKGLDMRKISGKHAKTYDIKLDSGTHVHMTTAQIMELYELLKREQARGHIFGSGIRIADISRGKLSPSIKQVEPVLITVEDAQRIVDNLSDKQKQLADRLAWFMGDQCAAWGNETSLLMYGYKKFNEQNYYPIHSDSNYTQTNDKNDKSQNGAFAALKNLGMTKQVQQGAHNPIIIGDIFDTFTQHVDDMASYNGLMPALSDAMKWYNYKETKSTGEMISVKRAMERRAGIHAKGYFETFIKQLNGVNDRGERIGIANWLTSNAKAASVGANLRVVLQQPASYIRAAAVIDPKYLAKGVVGKPMVADAKKYCPIALWKSWGFYDISVGKDMRSLLFNDSNFDEKLREWSMAPAGFADEVTWGALFRACYAEQRDLHPDWSEEWQKEAAGERLTEIVDKTQVVDSPFHKSQLMRSSDGLVKMQTSFMAEPTKTYNLLRSALVNMTEKKDKESRRRFARTAVTWLVSATAVSAAAAIADVGRDDDEDESTMEKYWAALGANMLDNVNPLGMIPFVKDVFSLLQGYEPSRIDMQAADKLINVGKVWLKQLNAEKGEKPYTHWYMAYQTAQAVSSLTGIPIGNLMREVDSIASMFGANLKTKTSVASAAGRYEKLYGAIVDGNTEKVERIEAALRDSEKSPKDIDSGIAKVLSEQDERIAEAYELREAGDIKALTALRKELMQTFDEETVDRAINLYETAAEKAPTEKNLDDELDAPLYDYADMEVVALQAFETGDTADLLTVIEEIKADSDASDPDAAVKSKATTLFKPVYVEAVKKGYSKKAARIKKILTEVFGTKPETIDKWVKD